LSTTTLGSPCPHCGKSTKVKSHGLLGSVCAACGYPRLIASQALLVEPPDAHGDLVLAYRHNRLSWLWRTARLGVGSVGLVTAALGLLFAVNEPLSLGWRIFIIAASLAPLAFALYAGRRANQLAGDIQSAIERSRKIAVKAWYQAHPASLDARSLSRSLQISETLANQYLVESELDAYLDAPEAERTS
jgi:hypothetical protein